MIYLIGGPPKCGKTTLAKRLSKELSTPWISTDTLQSVIKLYIDENLIDEKFPASAQRCDSNDEKYTTYSSDEIIKAYQKQTLTVLPAIDNFIASEIADGTDHIIEGYHLVPCAVDHIKRAYPNDVKNIFLVRTDKTSLLEDFKKSTTPNDWIIERTQNDETYVKIAEMIAQYSEIYSEAAQKFDFETISMDKNFDRKISDIIRSLT